MASLVYLKSKSGTIYVYESVTQWDEDAGKMKNKRKCIGHLDPETGDILPNGKRGGYQRKQTQRRKQTQPTCRVLGRGESLLFDKVCADTGLDEVLREVFPERWKAVLTCAYYLASEGRSLYRVEQWSRRIETPYGRALTQQEIGELLSRFTTDKARAFFSAWMDRHRSEVFSCICVSRLGAAQLGGGRLVEDLAGEPEQMSLLVVSGKHRRIPLYCFPVAPRGMAALADQLCRQDLPGGENPLLVLDQGYYTEETARTLWDRGLRFLLEVPLSVPMARDVVLRCCEGARMQEHSIFGETCLVHAEELDWCEHPCRLYACVSAADLNDGELKPGAHWHVVLSNEIDTAGEAVDLLCAKDAAVRFLADLQSESDRKRLGLRRVEAMNGRLFLQWIALMIRTRIHVVLEEHGWLERCQVQEVIDEMKNLYVVESAGKVRRSYTSVTPFQTEIGELFGLEYR